MKAMKLAGAFAFGMAATSLHAQSLEETYTKLCADSASAKGEVCATLRKGLIDKLSAESAGGAQPGQTAPQNASRPAPLAATMAALAGSPINTDSRWGVFDRLVGTQWASEDMGDKKDASMPRVYRSFLTFSSLDDGGALEIQDSVELTKIAPARIITLRPTGKPGIYDGEIRQPKVNGIWRTTFRTDEKGAIISDWYKVVSGGGGVREMHARWGVRLMPDGTLAIIGANGFEKNRPPLLDPENPEYAKYRLRPYSESDLQTLVAEQIASYPDLLAMEKQNDAWKAYLEQQQRERAARKASGGGLFRALLGAAVGVYAGKAGGLDTGQVLGAALKGASVTTQGSPLSGALGNAGSQLLSGGSATSALAGSVSGQAVNGASYPTRPNLALGACSGFSEGNYRARALEGGGDAQLYTMCGQAFEYYVMYKRAIAQGYSEADANRTYAAHEQSARVASGYLSSHRAD